MAEQTNPPSPPFRCDNPPKPAMDLATTLELLKSSPKFARFIRLQLRKAFASDTDPQAAEDAQKCLSDYCMPAGNELEELGYSQSEIEMAKVGKCTDHGRLLAIVADGYI